MDCKNNIVLVVLLTAVTVSTTANALFLDANSTAALHGGPSDTDSDTGGSGSDWANASTFVSNSNGSANAWARAVDLDTASVDFGVFAEGGGGDNSIFTSPSPSDPFYQSRGHVLVSETFTNHSSNSVNLGFDAEIYAGEIFGRGPLISDEWQRSTVDIEIVALSLTGASPIPIDSTTLWDVEVVLARDETGSNLTESSSTGSSLGGTFVLPHLVEPSQAPFNTSAQYAWDTQIFSFFVSEIAPGDSVRIEYTMFAETMGNVSSDNLFQAFDLQPTPFFVCPSLELGFDCSRTSGASSYDPLAFNTSPLQNISSTPVNSNPVPAPSTLSTFALGLFGLLLARRRWRFKLTDGHPVYRP